MAVTPAAIIPPRLPPGTPWPAQVLWFLAGTAANALIYQQFDYGEEIQPAGDVEVTGTQWMHIQVKWEDINSTITADDVIFTLDVLNYTNDAIDNTWDPNDFTLVSAEIQTFCSSLAPYTSPRFKMSQIRYYPRSFQPYSESKPFTDAGGPAHVLNTNIPATGSACLPPSTAVTITEETASRKHWGRIYCPTPAAATCDNTTGRFSAAHHNTYATAFKNMVEGLWDAHYKVVVPTTSSGGAYDPALPGDWSVVPARTLQSVSGVRCDDVFDVHRSRRHKYPLTRSVLPLPAAATKPAP